MTSDKEFVANLARCTLSLCFERHHRCKYLLKLFIAQFAVLFVTALSFLSLNSLAILVKHAMILLVSSKLRCDVLYFIAHQPVAELDIRGYDDHV